MGYLTTITFYNDFWGEIKQNKDKLFDSLDEAIFGVANRYGKFTNASLGQIIVQPSAHADDHQLYIHRGNLVFNVAPWTNEFEEMAERNPEFLEESIKAAQNIVTEAKKRLKKLKKS